MYLYLINLIGPYMNREINRLFTGHKPTLDYHSGKKKKAYISNEQGTMIILSYLDKVYQL